MPRKITTVRLLFVFRADEAATSGIGRPNPSCRVGIIIIVVPQGRTGKKEQPFRWRRLRVVRLRGSFVFCQRLSNVVYSGLRLDVSVIFLHQNKKLEDCCQLHS